MNNAQFLTAKEVAKLFRLEPNTIYKLVKENRIPHFKVGGSIRFSRSVINSICGEDSAYTKDRVQE